MDKYHVFSSMKPVRRAALGTTLLAIHQGAGTALVAERFSRDPEVMRLDGQRFEAWVRSDPARRRITYDPLRMTLELTTQLE